MYTDMYMYVYMYMFLALDYRMLLVFDINTDILDTLTRHIITKMMYKLAPPFKR